jgi:RNA polymerase sigma-70 factor (ECF subfamily)
VNLSSQEKCDLERLFDTYYNRVYAFLYARLNNTAQAEDLACQTFLKIAEKFDTYDNRKGAMSTWIFTIALNEMRDFLRSRKGLTMVDYEELTNLQSSENVEDDYAERELRRTVFSLLGSLDERHRSIVLLKYYGDLTNKEISGILGISETNISTILNRSIKILKNELIPCDETLHASYKG